jgi:hypothetical protein
MYFDDPVMAPFLRDQGVEPPTRDASLSELHELWRNLRILDELRRARAADP